ncbi:MAG: SMI1/KNR4 family protein [Lachnospiraceae bacterium]|nr:SMI1/KNR4 family protein [Lachnospiraceae bacterium]
MFRNTSKPLTREEIETMESESGITLPDSFVEHYLVYNGGIPSRPYFYSEEEDVETEIQIFSPIKYGFDNLNLRTIEQKYALFKEKSALMSRYLPFANDHGANPICINLDNGEVSIVYMDNGELDQASFQFLAEDFAAFLDGLSEESIDD